MKNLGSLLLFFTLVLEASSVKATVDKPEFLAGELVTLTLTVVGEEYEKMPDIPSIAGFPVLHSERHHSSNFTYREGKSIMELTESLQLTFKPTHTLQVPAFGLEVDGKMLSTQPLTIKLVQSRDQQQPKFILTLTPNKEHIYFGEPLILTLRYHAKQGVDVEDFKLQPLTFEHFFARPLGKEKSYEQEGYTVHEMHYLLTAKSTGRLTLEPQTLQVAEHAPSGVSLHHTLRSKPLEITVEPIVGDEPDLVGRYTPKTAIDRLDQVAHQPVNFSIEIQGVGDLEGFEDIHYSIHGVTVYEDDAKVEYGIHNGQLISHYTKHYVLIGTNDFQIPDRELRAFDYTQNRFYSVRIKGYTVHLHPDKSLLTTTSVVKPSLPSTTATPFSNVSLSQWKMKFSHLLESLPHTQLKTLGDPLWWIGWGMAFLLGVLVTLLVPLLADGWRTLRRKIYNRVSDEPLFEEALRELYPHMGKSSEVEEMVHALHAHREDPRIKIDKKRLKMMMQR